MTKFFYLSSCSTCQRIIKDLDIEERIPMQDIKKERMTEAQVDAMEKISGSYESLFSRRAIKYKTLGLKDKDLSEQEIRSLILEEYTFLKRPVLVLEDRIFVGNSAKNISAAKAALG